MTLLFHKQFSVLITSIEKYYTMNMKCSNFKDDINKNREVVVVIKIGKTYS